MSNFDSSINDYNNRNAKLYSFLATRYDIRTLANKISATQTAQENLLNLKKRVGNNDIATA